MTDGNFLQVGEEIIVSEGPDRRKYARCETEECVSVGLIEKRNYGFYVITSAGIR